MRYNTFGLAKAVIAICRDLDETTRGNPHPPTSKQRGDYIVANLPRDVPFLQLHEAMLLAATMLEERAAFIRSLKRT